MAKPRVKKSVQDGLNALPTEYLACRVANGSHNWALADIQPHPRGIRRWHWCKRCKTNRFQIIRRDGVAEQSRYDYPDSYAMVGFKSSAEGNQLLRLEYNRRIIESGAYDRPDYLPAAWENYISSDA